MVKQKKELDTLAKLEETKSKLTAQLKQTNETIAVVQRLKTEEERKDHVRAVNLSQQLESYFSKLNEKSPAEKKKISKRLASLFNEYNG